MSKQINKTNILNYLKEHYSEFKNKYNVEQLGLFGSYARDEATESSDIDIFVKMKPSLFDMVAIKNQIEHDLDKKVDIIREHKNIKPFLLKKIKEDLIYIFSN
jgi:predicted nucleotidyltransferase